MIAVECSPPWVPRKILRLSVGMHAAFIERIKVKGFDNTGLPIYSPPSLLSSMHPYAENRRTGGQSYGRVSTSVNEHHMNTTSTRTKTVA